MPTEVPVETKRRGNGVVARVCKNQRLRERKTISKTKWNLSALGKKQDVNAATTEAGPSTAHQELQRLISREEREVQVNLRAK